MEPIYEGKAKRLYTTDNPNVLRMEYKDDATAGNGAKKAQFENKGRMNKAITLVIYRMLESKGVKTHLVADVDDINIDVKKGFHPSSGSDRAQYRRRLLQPPHGRQGRNPFQEADCGILLQG